MGADKSRVAHRQIRETLHPHRLQPARRMIEIIDSAGAPGETERPVEGPAECVASRRGGHANSPAHPSR